MNDQPPPVNDEDPEVDGESVALVARIEDLKLQRQDLDDAITALELRPMADQLQIARLKKQKLMLRDQIAKLEDRLMPDIIA